MNDTHRVLWGEGMLLTPQHFQQWDRHYQALVRDRVLVAQPFDWGLSQLEFDEAGMAGGQVGLLRCTGVFQDGVGFCAPERDRLPADRSPGELFDAAKGTVVHLAMPRSRSGGVLVGDDGDAAGDAPFVRDSRLLPDETRAGADRDVAIAMVNLSIRFEGESMDDFRTLEIARILAAPNGDYILDPGFIPASVRLDVAPFLTQSVRRTLEILSSRSGDLAAQQRKTGGMAEVAGFWLLHTFHSHMPALAHAHRHPALHPEVVYMEYARLAAELCTFADGHDVKTLPAYDHGDLSRTFGELDARLRELLDTVVPSRCTQVPLDRPSDSMYVATVHDDRVLEDGQLYLGVLSDMEEARLLVEFPGKSKVSSRERVQQLLTMAMPGIRIEHVAMPPAEIPVQPGRLYFRLVKSGEHWEAIAATRSIALHVPPDFPGLKLELMSVQEANP